MDIADVSMVMAQNQLMNNVGVAMMAKSLDSNEMVSDALSKMMESSVNPTIGQNIDIKL